MLVTVPPAYTERVKTVNPTRFFLQVVGKSLIEVLFDQDAAITDEVSETLQNLLKTLDIDEIPGMYKIYRINTSYEMSSTPNILGTFYGL